MFWLVLMFVLFHQPVSTSDMALDYKEILFDVFDASTRVVKSDTSTLPTRLLIAVVASSTTMVIVATTPTLAFHLACQ